jgi:hypothetical protein
MADTFTREITFLKNTIEAEGAKVTPVTKEVIKKATFKELSRTDASQHKLQFSLMSMALYSKSDDDKFSIDGDALYNITIKSINALLITDDKFDEKDKAQFLNDSKALINFGTWFLGEKITPFFSKLMSS